MDTKDARPPGGFASTRWSVVLAAGRLVDPRSREALAQLFETYWSPLYAYARRHGRSEEDARDLIQGFFAYLLEKEGLRHADEAKGLFRSYLLGAFKHFLSRQWQKGKTLKRGGDTEILSLDLETAERSYRLEPIDDLTPDRVYERRWALTILDRGMTRLRKEYVAAGKEDRFDAFKDHLVGNAERGSTTRAAKELDISPGAARVAVHRLRRRFRELIQAEVAQTVERAEDVEAEIRELLAALSR